MIAKCFYLLQICWLLVSKYWRTDEKKVFENLIQRQETSLEGYSAQGQSITSLDHNFIINSTQLKYATTGRTWLLLLFYMSTACAPLQRWSIIQRYPNHDQVLWVVLYPSQMAFKLEVWLCQIQIHNSAIVLLLLLLVNFAKQHALNQTNCSETPHLIIITPELVQMCAGHK